MATIATRKIELATDTYDVNRWPIKADATFVKDDLVKVTAGEIDKLSAGGATATDLALAVEPAADTYYEPLGESPSHAQAIVLGKGVLVSINVSGVLAEDDFNVPHDITVSGGIPMVNLASVANPAFVPLRLADPLYDGVVGDTNPRVIGYFLDSVSAGE